MVPPLPTCVEIPSLPIGHFQLELLISAPLQPSVVGVVLTKLLSKLTSGVLLSELTSGGDLWSDPTWLALTVFLSDLTEKSWGCIAEVTPPTTMAIACWWHCRQWLARRSRTLVKLLHRSLLVKDFSPRSSSKCFGKKCRNRLFGHVWIACWLKTHLCPDLDDRIQVCDHLVVHGLLSLVLLYLFCLAFQWLVC